MSKTDVKAYGRNSKRRGWVAAIFLGLLMTTAQSINADALVVTQAMKAATIVELFVESEQVRVAFEVGAMDLNAFANVLPDDLYEKLTGDQLAFRERQRQFVSSDWILQADGQPLECTLERVTASKRLMRDEVTGDILPNQPGDAEIVIRVDLTYPLENRPESLTIRTALSGKSGSASIGFVCYHNEIPVNDFRYLPAEATLDLDWSDPWYSRFRHANLRRQYDAPMSAFLYVEAYEVRKEIIVRARDLQTWLNLDLRDDGRIPVEQQAEIKRRAAEFLLTKNPVTIDGQAVEGRLDRIHFIYRTLRSTGVIEPAIELDLNSATLGVVIAYPVNKLPNKVSMAWELFSPRIQVVPAVASDEAGGLPSTITPEGPLLTWNNFLTNPTSPRMMTVAALPERRQIVIPLLSVFCACLIVILLIGSNWRRKTGNAMFRFALIAIIVVACLGVVSLPLARVTVADPFAKRPDLTEPAAVDVLASLLHNVYRSFDHHDENLVYDRLANSIAGELLADVYLQTRKSMEIKNQGGMRISVNDIDVVDLQRLDDHGTTLTFHCRWRVSGWISHWGHVHRRVNEHVARVTLGPRDNMWKITAIEMLDEKRVEPT